MLACLKHDYQISELISFFFANESFDIVMRVVHIAEVLEDSEHNLGIYTCHSKCLHETS
jgi:hypothetical protein